MPMASAPNSSTAATMSVIPILMPRFRTVYPLFVRMMSTRFLPMSWTSPLTVAKTMVPLPPWSAFSMNGSR